MPITAVAAGNLVFSLQTSVPENTGIFPATSYGVTKLKVHYISLMLQSLENTQTHT